MYKIVHWKSLQYESISKNLKVKSFSPFAAAAAYRTQRPGPGVQGELPQTGGRWRLEGGPG